MTAPQLPPGHVVAGKYSIVGVLGFGGTAATYRAAGADARAFAVKIFDPALAQRSDVMGSLEQVYGASNSLPGTDAARIVDAGYDGQTGAPFSVTELLPHPSLADVVAQRPMAMADVASFAQSLGRVLDEAHGRQLLHLALKPTNVFVAAAPGRPITLTDFGAAYARGAVPSQEGHALSAPWMAPEQLRQGVPIGPAADVFSMALVVFHALTGKSYWLSCAHGAPDFGALAREIVAPRTPASVRASELGAPLPATLDIVLARALAVDPGERYRSAGELGAAIAALASGGRGDSATAVLDTSTLGGPSDLGMGGPLPAAGAPPADALGSTMAIPEGMGMGMFPGPGPSPSPYGKPGPAAGAPLPAAGMGPEPSQFATGGLPAAGGGLGGPGAPPYGGPGAPGMGGPGLGGQPVAAQGAPPYGEPPPPSVLAPTGVPQQSKALPIILAAGIVVLLGGVAAFLLAGRRARHDDGPIAVAAPSATPIASGAPSADPSAAPSAAAAAGSAAPAADSAAPAASAAPSTDPEVALTCNPDCEEITIDGKKLDDPSKPTTLPPGSHKVTVAKSGYASVNDTIKVEAGKRFEKQYKLTAKPSAPAGPGPGPTKAPAPGPQKNCGKFLKRCN